ncbi:putative lipid phosphate phosphatase 3, chloroplastic [Momordica charantia]|uniref:Lipid phosphate phosphatase 3, chloroplastic n=1 Tax=Momordica charantia TaxID=3673 RepID=A0A6J1DZL0_MOMCH|nr:putative lipid phosphate phosphatase 3, chloroplastic [Momordica charantia]XP_022158500.1 putative lipid phosphate phosphatase 3, chloroplastic [Momordica charantia]
MREAHRSGHQTAVSGGAAAVLKRRRLDWLMVLVLMFMYFGIFKIQPFRRYVGRDMIANVKYPLMGVTIPFWTVPLYAVVLPIAIFLAAYMRRRDVYDLHDAILGILLSVLVTGVLTEATKNATGRPRPDFFWRCFPDGNEVYNRFGNVVCHGKKSFVLDGYKSFPSGHASWSFAGLGFLSLYLSSKLRVFEHGGNVAKLLLALFPLLVAYVVGIFMVNDYMHHSLDVLFGALIGLVVATLIYLQFFPSPYPQDVFFPTSEQSRTNALRSNVTANANSGVDIEAPMSPENGGR